MKKYQKLTILAQGEVCEHSQILINFPHFPHTRFLKEILTKKKFFFGRNFKIRFFPQNIAVKSIGTQTRHLKPSLTTFTRLFIE